MSEIAYIVGVIVQIVIVVSVFRHEAKGVAAEQIKRHPWY